MLRATLAPEAEQAIRVSAARWFEAQGLLAEAIPLRLGVHDAPAQQVFSEAYNLGWQLEHPL